MPLIDSRSLGDEVIERDLCIIGAGPAGISMAREFAGGPQRVALIESGGLKYDDEVQSLAEGEVAGLDYPPLASARLRRFGGTTGHWGGNVRPLDPLDFQERPWIPHSGWPFGLETLQSYYRRAADFFRIPPNAFDIDAWREALGDPLSFEQDGVVSQLFHTVAEDKRSIGEVWREPLTQSPNVDIFLHATAVDITTDASVRSVRQVTTRTLTGKTLRFRARFFVLATGGIENARILLVCAKQQREGLGNEHALVGRFFQEHPTIHNFACLLPADPWPSLNFYKGIRGKWGKALGVWRLAGRLQRKNGLHNNRYQLKRVFNSYHEVQKREGIKSLRALLGAKPDPEEHDIGQHLANVIADIDHVADAAYQRLFIHPDYPVRRVTLVHVGEQIPNFESRVHLGDATDRLGQRRVVLKWNLLPQDSENVKRSAMVLSRQFGASDLGRVVLKIPDGVFHEISPGRLYHHMGTTRMHEDPRQGVVNADCRVHRLENLYVAGSSVFPTSGNANPTFSIVALAIRLADHLGERLKG